MRIPRIYQPFPLEEGSIITLTPEAVHHLIHVLRLSVHDPLTIFNGQGGEFSAEISKIEKKKLFAIIKKFQNIERESPLKIHLGQGISRGEKMDFSIQKSVELGITRITPIITERCSIKLSDERWQKRMERWKNIIINACEQCGRNTIPTIEPITTLSDWFKQTQATLKLLLSPQSEKTLDQLTKPTGEIALLIGPEGGLSEKENQQAQDCGFQELRIGNRILRTETATLTAISILQSRWGDL